MPKRRTDNEDFRYVSERLKALIKFHGTQQDELARSISMDPAQLNGYVSGKRIANVEITEKLAEFFNITPDELLGREAITCTKVLRLSVRDFS